MLFSKLHGPIVMGNVGGGGVKKMDPKGIKVFEKKGGKKV